ncbi:swib complex baf60b domain-containing protein [Phytophthora cinnamomi]|uniref:swib complex baf60b domain-containing protein n=1 Tax=Phytophthora cinnamomi TaxID=4785 RepID=UPI0035593881|nr:swib complex baf60b domain-containing protein [Phytophthora cinnamomi]
MSDGMGLGLDLSGLGQEPMAPAVDAAQLTEAIRLILKDADLEQLSRRMIRKQLEAQFHADLSSYKDVINATILEIIEQQQADEEEEEEEPDPSDEDDDADADDEQEQQQRSPRKKAAPKKKAVAPKKRKRKADGEDGGVKKAGGGFNAQLSLSPELAQVVGAETMARPQVVKALWAYIREHNLQDPKNKKLILLDDTLRGVFQRNSFTMFSMNKFVKRHVRKPDDLPPGGWSQIPRDGVSSDEDESKPAKKKQPAKRKKKTVSTEDGGDEGKKKANPFYTELSVSPELASLIGRDRMARPEIVKALWAYIHEHNLQDPQDKRTILLDDRMRQVFQRDSFTMFSMNKYIKRHARKFADVPPNGWADIPRDGLSSDEDEAKTKKKARKAK